MAWSSIPNFGDPYARINERVHPSGARLIEVLYGGRDASGKPTPPENLSDGHGHWLALEIDGCYQMLSWRHPDSEGGLQEFGVDRKDNALSDLEADISAKEQLCSQAASLTHSQDWKGTSIQYNKLLQEWEKIYNWHTPKEQELWRQFQSARESFYERRDSNRAKNKLDKQAIISEAKGLESSSDWKSTAQKFKDLFEKWKSIGPSGKADDDYLWSEFNSARQTFYARRSKHFEELNEQRVKNNQVKQALIAEARSVAQYSTEWKSTGEKLKELMDRWKAVGSAGRDADNSLWNEFNGIRQSFFERRRLYYEEQDRIFQANAAEKSRIVQEASSIASRCDYSVQSTERMKELDQAWKSIGSAGREQNAQLWSLFQSAKDSFWSGKRSYSEQRQQEWRQKLYDAIDRKRTQILNLEQQISDLQFKMSGMRNQEYIDNMLRWIDEKEAKIRELEMAIQDMERKL